MSYPLNRVANEEALEIVQVGFESQRGTAVTPDHKWYGKFTTTEDRPLVDDKPTAYVCRNYACDRPVTNPESLASQLENAARAGITSTKNREIE